MGGLFHKRGKAIVALTVREILEEQTTIMLA